MPLKFALQGPFSTLVQTLASAIAVALLLQGCSLLHVKDNSDGADAGDAETQARTICMSNGRACFEVPHIVTTSWGITSVLARNVQKTALAPTLVVAAHGSAEFIELMPVSGAFQAVSHSKLKVAPWQVVAGDFDLDGTEDLAASSPGSSSELGEVSFWRSSKSSWTQTASQKIGAGTYAVASRNTQVAGNIVVAAASYVAQTLVPFISRTGAAPIAGNSLSLEFKPTALEFGAGTSASLYVVGNGASQGRVVTFDVNGGTLSQVAKSEPFGKSLNDIKLGDINGDSLVDAVIVDDSDSSILYSLKSDANHALTILGQHPLPANSHAVTLDDFDRDGRLDCATISGSSTSVQLCFGNGHGAFEDCVLLPHGVDQPTDILSRDLDSDHLIDLVVVGYEGQVSILRGGLPEN